MSGQSDWVIDFPSGSSDRSGSSPGSPGGEVDDRLKLSDVAKILRRARRRVIGVARAEERLTFARLVREHLATDPETVDIVQESWPPYEHVNVQAGLDAWLAESARVHEVVGLVNYRHRDFGFADMLRSDSLHGHENGPMPGNVARINLPSGPDGAVRACVECAVYLVAEGDRRAALFVRRGGDDMGRAQTSLEVVATQQGYAEQVAAEVRAAALVHNVYRGQVVSFDGAMFGERSTVLSFNVRSTMSADQLILPPETLAAIERQVVGVARHRERLLAARQHLKRGLLLFGPPGVGKTHTVRYLVGQLTDSTVVLLSGESLHLIGAACSVARTLQPSVIVIEDVDLIAEDRGRHPGQHPMLFQLLNEMDGLDEDADVLFILTTNRADVLEPALAQRPGRVDQAVLIKHPDVDARRRLFELYRGDLAVDTSRLDSVLERTAGVTASFLKELLRRAALISAEALPEHGSVDDAASQQRLPLAVSADQLDSALDELLDTRNTMTRTLLGAASPSAQSIAGPEGAR